MTPDVAAAGVEGATAIVPLQLPALRIGWAVSYGSDSLVAEPPHVRCYWAVALSRVCIGLVHVFVNVFM